MILNFSSFNKKASLFALALVLNVKVPVESFERFSRKPLPALSAKLWLAEANQNANAGRAVLLVGPSAQRTKWDSFAIQLRSLGFNVLSVDSQGKLEDVQSGVIFLRTDGRINAQRVAIVALQSSANAATTYASANRQIANIVDGLVVVDPNQDLKNKNALFDALKKIVGIPVVLVASDSSKHSETAINESKAMCQTRCYTLKESQRNKILDFLKNTNGKLD